MILKNSNHSGIYGTGSAGMQVLKTLEKMNIVVDFFLDNDSKRSGKILYDKQIIDINKVPQNTIILIVANPVYRIHERLIQVGIEKWDYVDPEWIWLYSEGFDTCKVRDILHINREKIYKIYKMLYDEFSRNVFRAVLKHRMDHDLDLINGIYDKNQYFGNDVIPFINGIFADCGAFIGDTLKRIIRQNTGV